ncbi:PepSY domain-containing protein [Rhodoplanes serenus]|nr:PepSY domain-containing protein [Rhodoplanes serenus]
MMAYLILLVVLFLAAAPASAGPLCTSAPPATWLPLDTLRARVEAEGYRIVVLKTTAGNCYEIYGRDRDGRRVEIYFDPVSGDVVKASIR